MPILQPKVFIIILNWNGKEDTLACLNSLKKSTYSNQEIVVVDNGSCDDSVEQIKALYPSVIVLETGENLGLSLIHISEPRDRTRSRMPSSA